MAHPDLDRLLDYSLRFAQNMLQNRGAFYPFAAKIGQTGDLNPVAIQSSNDTPQPSALLAEYTELLKSLASDDELQAAALCYDSLVSKQGDASKKMDSIAVALEHANGECVTVYLPYSKKFFGGYRYEALVAVAGEKKFFS